MSEKGTSAGESRTAAPRQASRRGPLRPSSTAPGDGHSFLFPIEEVLGYPALPAKEKAFVDAILQGAKKADAARSAGFDGDAQALAEKGCKLAKTGKIQAVLNRAWVKAGASPDEIVGRIAERARRAHAAADALMPGTAKWTACMTAARQEDTLLASIAGKLKLRISGEVRCSVSVQEKPTVFRQLAEALAGENN